MEATPTGTPTSDDVAEILAKVAAYETDHAEILQTANDHYKLYRAQPTRRRKENSANTFIPEIFTETEALATAVFESVFVEPTGSLFFSMEGQDDSDDDRRRAMVSEAVIAKQLELNKFQAKFLPFLRMLITLGTYPIALPWVLAYKSYWDNIDRVRRPAFDCWDFNPFPIQCFYRDTSTEELEDSTWCARLREINAISANKMVKMEIWDKEQTEKALGAGLSRSTYYEQLRQMQGLQRPVAGAKSFTAIDYYGTLENRGDGEMYWMVISKTGQKLKASEINPYADGEAPYLLAKWIKVPDEPFGIGIAHINSKQQNEINDRRNFINDLLYASLYHMWLRSSGANITLPGGRMIWSPHKIIDGDAITDEHFRPLRPDLAGLAPAIGLEETDRETMRRQSGATGTLQAISQGITATEVQSIASEATRRVKAMIRSEVSTILRDLIYRAHARNMQFLDQDFSARLINERGETLRGLVSRKDLIWNPDIKVRLPTDLDFRPFKRRELIEILDVFSRFQDTKRFIPDPIIEELAITYGMDPRKFFKRDFVIESQTRMATQNPEIQKRAMMDMVNQSPAASQMLDSGGVMGL